MTVHILMQYLSVRPAASVSAIVSVLGAAADDPSVAWLGAVAAIGAVVVPAVIDWYRRFKAVEREEKQAEIALDAVILAQEVRKRVEIEALCETLRKEVSENRHKLASLQQTIVNLTAQLARLHHAANPAPRTMPASDLTRPHSEGS